MTIDTWCSLRFEFNDATVNLKLNFKSLCTTCTVGEVRSDIGHVKESIVSAFHHEVARWRVGLLQLQIGTHVLS